LVNERLSLTAAVVQPTGWETMRDAPDVDIRLGLPLLPVGGGKDTG
jgi:hypothetical protein